MADLPTGPLAATSTQRQSASAAKLRSLARSGFDVRSFLKNVTAIEIAAVVGLVVLIAAVIVIYTFLILPDQVRRLNLSNEVAANRTKIEELSTQAGDPAAVTRAYQEVHESLDAFRGQTLQPRTAGRLQIINLVNDLTRQTNVVLTGPIGFDSRNPLLEEAAEEDGKKSKRKTRKSEDEIRSYPSMSMTMTISGSYAQIREFLAKFETSRQFAIIESVSISSEATEDAESPRAGRRANVQSDSEAITLDVSMTAYFQPDGTAPVPMATVAFETGARSEQR